MTYMDPPTEANLHIRKIPIRVYSDFKDVCKKRGLPVNEAIIGLMVRFAETGGKVLERIS